ncbi:hypothetical protein Droror1_Dr00025953 [Drosera rotundifolia]
MNKENELESPCESLTDEERPRISQKFRAAKALLAQKRPRLLNCSPKSPFSREVVVTGVGTPAFVPATERVPLKELQTTRDSPLLVRCPRSFNDKDENTPAFGRHYVHEIHNELTLRSADRLLQRDLQSTPVSKPIDNVHPNSYCGWIIDVVGTSLIESADSKVNGISSALNPLDEDFDDTVLQQLDALCEEKFAEKQRLQQVTTDHDTIDK